ncbi:hypothetical protein B9G69_006180 [Bdellovibrio sp. SKB1291214]|uniref:hypothetical protein n=1 Tax=Bdellovibrio sp. SKB1291214 TaxID=1732569 RepID=UPI000B5170C9|nr:hypothetical protein [Bdellovibrio sp. SKB1291214]UYL10165.1 hypothetical protein B9G69_006180 [Bdellovibrio sp. SKB1291214]
MLKKIVLVFALLLSVAAGAQERSADEIAAMNESSTPDKDTHNKDQGNNSDTHSGHFVMGAYLNTLSQMKFKDAKTTVGGNTTTGEYDLKTGPSIGVDAHFVFWGKNHWGFSVGGFFDLAHKIKDASMAVFGTTKEAYLGILGFEGNAIYRFDRWYIPFGINTAMPVVVIDEGEVTDVDGGVGIQAGVGFLLGSSKRNAIEAKIRTMSFGYVQEINNIKVDTERGTGASVSLGWKFVF